MVNVNTTDDFFSVFLFPELGLKDSKNSTPEKFAYICRQIKRNGIMRRSLPKRELFLQAMDVIVEV